MTLMTLLGGGRDTFGSPIVGRLKILSFLRLEEEYRENAVFRPKAKMKKIYPRLPLKTVITVISVIKKFT